MTTDVVVMTRRGLTLMVRSPAALGSAAGMPIILLLLMSVSFGKIVMPGAGLADYVQYAAPLFVVMGVVFGALSTAVAAHQDCTSGFDDRLRTLPISPIAPLTGRIVADIVRNLVTLILVTAVAVALGFRMHGGFGGALVYLVLPLAFGFGVAWLMVAVAMSASSAESAVAVMNAVMLVASFLSTGFVEKNDLPGWAQPIAAANPVSHIAAAMRSAADGGALAGSDTVITLLWSAGLTILCGAVAVRAYRSGTG